MIQLNPKSTCTKCKRFINLSLPYCPYCGTENKKTVPKPKKESDKSARPSADANTQDKRSKIQWSDETSHSTVDYASMYDAAGTYNPNYDVYYNDTLPQIADEIDSLLAGKEKIVLKAVFSLTSIAAIIAYLILTL